LQERPGLAWRTEGHEGMHEETRRGSIIGPESLMKLDFRYPKIEIDPKEQIRMSETSRLSDLVLRISGSKGEYLARFQILMIVPSWAS
jgi:hypothetical protein